LLFSQASVRDPQTILLVPQVMQIDSPPSLVGEAGLASIEQPQIGHGWILRHSAERSRRSSGF
jgi:hypothetical protein